MAKKEITKILIFRTDRIGDLVNTSSVLKSLKKYYHNSEISLVCSEYNSSIAFNYEFIDNGHLCCARPHTKACSNHYQKIT